VIFPSWKNHNSAEVLLPASCLRITSDAPAQQRGVPQRG
jgi:hypothetical protein